MKLLLLVAIFGFLIVGCNPKEKIHQEDHKQQFTKAIAVINPIGDSGAMGQVTFEKVSDGVLVKAELSGTSEGHHGFHIHQYGDCSALDGTSAGGHFNPEGMEHSNRDAMNRHMGDMGNVEGSASSKAVLEYVDKSIDINKIIGRGVILHAGEDDLTSQPSGAAGARIACGVIGIAE